MASAYNPPDRVTRVHFSYDPEEEATQDDPFPIYKRLRDESPVYRQERLRCWVLSRFADVHEALCDHRTFSSAQGLTWDTSPAQQAGILPMLVTTDPPAHTQLRALINRGLTPKRVAALEPEIRASVRGTIAALRRSGGGDLVHDLAVPLPTAIIGQFLGVPEDDRGQFHAWAGAVVRGTSGAAYHADHHRAARALYEYFAQRIRHHRDHPGNDLISGLLIADLEGQRLSEADVLGFCFNLVVGGIETTTNLLSSGAVLLHHHPHIRQQLASAPDRIPAAIEEMLRLETPVQGLCRTTTRELTLRGVGIAAGEKILLLFGAANRDEREFANPDGFDLDRVAARHLAFGYGAHYCIGAALARLMGRVAFEELLDVLGEHRLAIERGRRLHAAVSRGWECLPIELG